MWVSMMQMLVQMRRTETPLEACVERVTQEEERVFPLAKRQRSPKGLREEPTQAP